MKDAFCLAVLTAKVLCLVMFVNMLRPDHINPVQAASAAQYCKAGHSAAQACDLGVNVRRLLAMTAVLTVHKRSSWR